MTTAATGKQDTKTALLQVGMDLMLEKGYSNTGINDVLSACGVPKGSFYHHFDSKENYAVAIIHHFDACYSEVLMQTLRNQQQSPLERLKTFCENNKAMLAAQSCSKGCLIGNLSQEMSDQSEVLRKELSQVMCKWRDIIAGCIDEGQKRNEIKSRRSAHELAEVFSSAWSGAVMRAKTAKSTEPLDVVIEVMFNDVLKT
jgi:TetR/AcrR family transcriptional repressor of nem operon